MGIGRYLAVIALAASTLIGGGEAEARREPVAALPAIAAVDLPKEARIALARIRDNGPFPYERDGVPFGNREALLPPRPRGYYHEYTVETPGSRSRGARRIVCGGKTATLAECYYSDDHYQSFKSIHP
ncbi:MAG TPA: ribonuclease domain-containing protein [Casimicrobiaceae bacterium]|nr:ribonuclease domain-containing protein [Casimicrobiaceae bacterium]